MIYVRQPPEFATGPDCFMRQVKVPWGRCAPVQPRATVENHMAAYNRAVDQVAHAAHELLHALVTNAPKRDRAAEATKAKARAADRYRTASADTP